MANAISWYEHWKKEYKELCNSRWKETRDRMAAKFKDADDYILKEYMRPILQLYKSVDQRMYCLHDFVEKNYNKDKKKFHKICGRYSHEFNRYHVLMKDLIKNLKQKLKIKTMKPASDILEACDSSHILSNCTYYIFEYENLLRKFGFLVEKMEVL